MSSDKKVLIKGVLWTAIGKYSGLLLGMVVTMVLARILKPEEFGTVALANVIISFLTLLSSMGIAPAIIQKNNLTQNDLNSIFTFTCIIGLGFAIAFFFSSWMVANFYNNMNIIPVCQILSVSLFFSTINMVPNALMSKHLRFKENARRTIFLHLIISPVSILAAIKGAGIYALLISPVFTSIGIYLYNHHYYPVKITMPFQFVSIRKIISYSTYQFFFQVTNFLTSNVDKLLMGKSLGSKELGYYQMSNQLIQIPAGNITGVIYPVMHPIFTKYQNDKYTLITKYETIIKLLASCIFPFSTLLYFCGSEIIHIMYGPNWEYAVPAFKIMSIAIPALVILPVTGTFFQSCGEIRNLFQIGVINSFVAISSIAIACFVFRNLRAVAWAIVIYNYSSLLVTYLYMYVKVLHSSCYRFLSVFILPFLGSIILGFIFYIESRLFSNNMISGIIIKSCSAIIFIVLYLQLTKQFSVWTYCKKYIRKLSK